MSNVPRPCPGALRDGQHRRTWVVFVVFPRKGCWLLSYHLIFVLLRNMTLFDKYGGTPTVSSVVKNFYKEILQNSRLKPYFSGVATEKLIHHQIIFISQLLGKPVSEKLNNDRAMKTVHAGKRISESAFLEVTEVLKNVLVAHHMEPADIDAVMALIMGFKSAIVELPTITRTVRSGS